MTPENFLEMGPAILARLREVLPPEVHVLSAADLDAVAEADQPTPAVHVLFWDHAVGAEPRMPAVAPFTLTWLTVVVTRNVADIEQGEYARQAAGPLATEVISALHRQTLSGPDGQPLKVGRLTPATPPIKSGYSAGRFYLPLAWDCQVKFVGKC